MGPLLLLLFAAGWRWLEADGAVGLTGGLGAAVKIQPGVVLAWALLRLRLRDVLASGKQVAGVAFLTTGEPRRT